MREENKLLYHESEKKKEKKSLLKYLFYELWAAMRNIYFFIRPRIS